MPLTARIVHIGRDPHSDEVLARGGDAEAESLLERSGFIPVHRGHDRFHRLPRGLEQDEQVRRARRAVAVLKAVGYAPQHDPEFASDVRLVYDLSLGARVAGLAEHIRAARHSQWVTAVITELVTPADGVLPAVTEVLHSTADFLQGLGEEADPAHADRIRHLADQLSVITTEVGAYRNLLADRHTDHPLRPACTGVDPLEAEASVTCSCPPAPPPPPTSARRTR
ncbi:hypothetical protein [Streptomyces sp. NBC_01244]|uniref:hypothetical protein n=1 Tax=Streptomyces sp. NBC_01244 TaxID=2903797 RepID=UPI002E143BC4|nr:hypothetical protein OG247_31750 [Streptomyces sp. NBC_01244]